MSDITSRCFALNAFRVHGGQSYEEVGGMAVEVAGDKVIVVKQNHKPCHIVFDRSDLLAEIAFHESRKEQYAVYDYISKAVAAYDGKLFAATSHLPYARRNAASHKIEEAGYKIMMLAWKGYRRCESLTEEEMKVLRPFMPGATPKEEQLSLWEASA